MIMHVAAVPNNIFYLRTKRVLFAWGNGLLDRTKKCFQLVFFIFFNDNRQWTELTGINPNQTHMLS